MAIRAFIIDIWGSVFLKTFGAIIEDFNFANLVDINNGAQQRVVQSEVFGFDT